MQICLLRHGIAEPARVGLSDADRGLIPDGKKKLRVVLRAAKAAGVSPTLILSSPYRRAIQTAEIAATVLGYKGDIIKSDAFRPGCSPNEAWDELRVHNAEDCVLISGHEPLLGYLTGFLLNTPSLLVDLKKGAMLRVDVDQMGLQPRGVLRWYLTPKLATNSR